MPDTSPSQIRSSGSTRSDLKRLCCLTRVGLGWDAPAIRLNTGCWDIEDSGVGALGTDGLETADDGLKLLEFAQSEVVNIRRLVHLEGWIVKDSVWTANWGCLFASVSPVPRLITLTPLLGSISGERCYLTRYFARCNFLAHSAISNLPKAATIPLQQHFIPSTVYYSQQIRLSPPTLQFRHLSIPFRRLSVPFGHLSAASRPFPPTFLQTAHRSQSCQNRYPPPPPPPPSPSPPKARNHSDTPPHPTHFCSPPFPPSPATHRLCSRGHCGRSWPAKVCAWSA